MFLRFVREYFFPAQQVHQLLYLERGKHLLRQKCKAWHTSAFPDTAWCAQCSDTFCGYFGDKCQDMFDEHRYILSGVTFVEQKRVLKENKTKQTRLFY